LAIKEYKYEVALLNEKIDKYAKVVGKITAERDWAAGKQNSPQKANALLRPQVELGLI